MTGRQHSLRHSTMARATFGEVANLVFREGYTEVEEVLGTRLRMDGDEPKSEYLVKWKVRHRGMQGVHGSAWSSHARHIGLWPGHTSRARHGDTC